MIRNFLPPSLCILYPRFVIIYLASFVFLNASFGQNVNKSINDSSINFSSVKAHIRKKIDSDKIPSITVAVSIHGKTIWEESFGMADVENKIPATIHTPYYLASITKSFTSTAVMKLLDGKKVDLNAPVNNYLGITKLTSPIWDVKEATLLRVMTHSAGITTFDRPCYAEEQGCIVSFDTLIKRYGVVVWPPGDHFDYSNLNYGIIGQVVSHVSGETLNEFLETNIFLPLDMKNTFLERPSGQSMPVAIGYNKLNERVEGYTTSAPGASGAYGSIDDLIKFGKFILKDNRNKRAMILSDESIDKMLKTTISTSDSQGYGIGWWINEDFNGYRGVLAQGGTDVARAFLQLIPSEDIAVAVISNKGSDYPSELINEIISVMLPKFAQKAQTSNSQVSVAINNPSYLFVGKWHGQIHTYKRNIPLEFEIDRTGNIMVSIANQKKDRFSSMEFKEYRLSGTMPGNLDVMEDSGPYPYDLYVELYIRGNMLEGIVTTSAKPEAKYSKQLSYPVIMEKDSF